MKKRWYVVYEGDSVIANGTAEMCAKQLGVTKKTIHWYASKDSRKRGRRQAVSFDVDENYEGVGDYEW